LPDFLRAAPAPVYQNGYAGTATVEVMTMFLYLVQHGEAMKEEEDPSRGLSKKGMDDVWQTSALAQKRISPDVRIFHSGKTRALQTARIIADSVKPWRDPAEDENLAPMDDPGSWLGRLVETTDDIMLVGHLPYLAKLAGLLLCGNPDQAVIDFKMGGIVCLKRFDDGRWALEWAVVPEIVE